MMTALTNLARPRHFLVLGGTVLVIVGSAGALGWLGSISGASVFNPPYWINWVHLTFGMLVLGIAFVGGYTIQNAMTLVAAVFGSVLGLLGLLLGSYAANRYRMPELADPSEHLGHLAVGLLALWAWSNRKVRDQA
jgi:hypothetical protein